MQQGEEEREEKHRTRPHTCIAGGVRPLTGWHRPATAPPLVSNASRPTLAFVYVVDEPPSWLVEAHSTESVDRRAGEEEEEEEDGWEWLCEDDIGGEHPSCSCSSEEQEEEQDDDEEQQQQQQHQQQQQQQQQEVAITDHFSRCSSSGQVTDRLVHSRTGVRPQSTTSVVYRSTPPIEKGRAAQMEAISIPIPQFTELASAAPDTVPPMSYRFREIPSIQTPRRPGPTPTEMIQDTLTSDWTTAGKIVLFVGTWNAHRGRFPRNLDPFIQSNESHIYVMGTQECCPIERSIFSKKRDAWERLLKNALGPRYTMVRSHSLQTLHVAVFARDDVLGYISDVQSSQVATGVGGILGNKGSLGLCFRLANTSFLFMCSHFTAHHSNIHIRNFEYARSAAEMPLPVSSDGRPPPRGNIISRFDRVFWFGDLNYRLNGDRKTIEDLIVSQKQDVLLANDQLRIEMERHAIFPGFEEGTLTFHPTYKFDLARDTYDTSSKRRVPSFTDRVLWKMSNEICLLQYDSVPQIRTSDHRPVRAKFQVSVDLDPTPPHAEISAGPELRASSVCTLL